MWLRYGSLGWQLSEDSIRMGHPQTNAPEPACVNSGPDTPIGNRQLKFVDGYHDDNAVDPSSNLYGSMDPDSGRCVYRKRRVIRKVTRTSGLTHTLPMPLRDMENAPNSFRITVDASVILLSQTKEEIDGQRLIAVATQDTTVGADRFCAVLNDTSQNTCDILHSGCDRSMIKKVTAWPRVPNS